MDWIYESKVLAALRYFLSLHEADGVVELINDTKRSTEDVVDYIKWCERRSKEDKDTDIDSWYDEKGIE